MDYLYFIIHTICACIIAVGFGWVHEYLHIRKAKQLGLKFKVAKRFKNQVSVDTEDPEQIKQIANAPYKVLVPIAIVILALGIYFFQLGLIIGAGATLFLHVLSYRLEGKDGHSTV